MTDMTPEERVADQLYLADAEVDDLRMFARKLIDMCREVRPLVWTVDEDTFVSGIYCIWECDGSMLTIADGTADTRHPTIAAAKAAAEAHHAERVRGMLR